ncbi:MAG: hypothetical protein KDJ14_15610 [Xanthomonadales bacterium]|nr:hypothetical protein [Xanthomonadales bacterium]
MKRVLMIAGIVMLLLGGLISFGLLSYPDTETLFSVGDAALRVETQREPAPVLGYVLLGIGALCTALGVWRKA